MVSAAPRYGVSWSPKSRNKRTRLGGKPLLSEIPTVRKNSVQIVGPHYNC